MCPTEDSIEGCIASMQGFTIAPVNMGSRITNKIDITIRSRNVLQNRFKDEDDDDVVSLDPPPKIILDHWDINIVKMFSEKKQALLSAKFLMDIVMSYKLSLRNKSLFYAYSERLSSCMMNHLNYIHECFHDMEYYRISLPDITNYYSMLEDVLAIYCTVELKTISKICFKPDSNNNRECGMLIITDEKMYLKRLGKQAQKMAFILHNFLHRNENVLHVLMKMWYNKASPSCVGTVKYLYTLLLYEKPITDKSDESYCRYVINYLLWLHIENDDSKESMISVLNNKFGYSNHEITGSIFIRKVFDMSGNQLKDVSLIHLKNTTIERYFNEIKKIQQRRMFHDDGIDDSRSFESFLFDVNDDAEINNDESQPESDPCYESDSSDVVEIITLDSDDDEVQVISSNSSTNRNKTPQRDKQPTLHLNTPLISGTVATAAPSKVQRPPYQAPHRRAPLLDSTTSSVLRTITDVTRKSQSANSEHSVCKGGSARSSYSDISERFAAKRAQVRSRGRPSVDANSMAENVQNPYMSPPSSSIGTPDNTYPETAELEAHSPKCTINRGNGAVHGSSNGHHAAASLILYTPDSQDERGDQSFELLPRTPTDSEDRDANSGLDEDHDTGQHEQRKRRELSQVEISPTSQPKRRKVNGDIASTLLSAESLTMANKDLSDTTDSKNTTTGILFTSSVSKRRRNNSNEDVLPWEPELLEQQKDDIFSNSNDDRLQYNSSSAKSPLQSSVVPEHNYPIPLPTMIPKVITLNKVPLVEFHEPVFTTESGVKGLLGSDVMLLGQQAVIVESVEVMYMANEMTHVRYVRDKSSVELRCQVNDNIAENMVSGTRKEVGSSGPVEVITEDGDGRRMNATPSKDILKEACADLLLPEADQDETIGTTSTNHVTNITHITVITDEITNNSNATAISPTTFPGTSYRLQDFNTFEEQHKDSLSAASSCAGSVHGDDRSTLPNGFVPSVPSGDLDDRNSVNSFSSSYQEEDPLGEDNTVTSSPITTTAKEKHINFKGISAHVSSSSNDPSCNTNSTKDQAYLPLGSQSLKEYINSSITFVDLSLRKQWNHKCIMPEMGRKRPEYLKDFSFPRASPSLFVSELFDDDPGACGNVGIHIRQLTIPPVSRPTNPSKGNMSFTPFSVEYLQNTQDNSLTQPLPLHYDSNSSLNSNVIDVSYTVTTSNDSASLINKIEPRLTISVDIPKPEDLELEFSNSPIIFEEATKGLLEQMALETDTDTTEDNVILIADSNLFLANNANYYLLTNPSAFCTNGPSNACVSNVTPVISIPTQEVTKTDHSISAITASPSSTSNTSEELTPEEEEALNRLLHESMGHMNSAEPEGTGIETRLPFKKRRMSVGSKTANINTSYQQSKRKQRNSSSNKQSKPSSTCKGPTTTIAQSEISYPATKMMSIAEVQEQNRRKLFKTAAERKEMPVPTETPVAPAVNKPLFTTTFYPCNEIRPVQTYNRSSAYEFAMPVLPPPPHLPVASEYYSRLLSSQRFPFPLVPPVDANATTRAEMPLGNSYACHHRLSGSVTAAATLAAATPPQSYKRQQRRRPVVGPKREVTTAARTRVTSVQYK